MQSLTHARKAQLIGDGFADLFNISPEARHAAKAARYWSAWGPYAARRYCQRHGIPIKLVTLARVLACAEANDVEVN